MYMFWPFSVNHIKIIKFINFAPGKWSESEPEPHPEPHDSDAAPLYSISLLINLYAFYFILFD
jgi:hypothetical protein